MNKIIMLLVAAIVWFSASCAPTKPQCAPPLAPLAEGKVKTGEEVIVAYKPVRQKVTTYRVVETLDGCNKRSPCGKTSAKSASVKPAPVKKDRAPTPAPAPEKKKGGGGTVVGQAVVAKKTSDCDPYSPPYGVYWPEHCHEGP